MNETINVVTASAGVIAAMKNADNKVDFSQLLPYPESLVLEENWISESAENAARYVCETGVHVRLSPDHFFYKDMVEKAKLLHMRNPSHKIVEQMHRLIKNKKNSGFFSQADFAEDVWGTYGNAFGMRTRSTDTMLAFSTHPTSQGGKFFLALSEAFPDEEILHQWANEDLGRDCGFAKLKGGQVIETEVAPDHRGAISIDDKRKWTKFAFELMHPNEDPRKYEYDENWDLMD